MSKTQASDKENTSAAMPASSQGEGGDPSHGMPLLELNKRTAKIGNWIMKVSKARVLEYGSVYQGRPQTNHKLLVIFTTKDEGQYCTGLMKTVKKNVDELKTLLSTKFLEGNVFRMTKITFTADNTDYISTPFKSAIDLRTTTYSRLLTEPCHIPSVPSPPSPIKEIVSIPLRKGNSPTFDVTAVPTFSPVRYAQTAKGYRAIVDVTLVDGSITSTNKNAEIFFTTYIPASQGKQDCEAMNALVQQQGKPTSFFALKIFTRTTADKREITASDDFFWIPAEGNKAEQLQLDSQGLQSLPDSQRERLTKTDDWEPKQARDFLAEPALHNTLALLEAYSGNNARPVDDKVFQLNYCQIEPPEMGTNLLTKWGNLFLPRTLAQDPTASLTLALREKAALSLAGLDPDDKTASDTFQRLAAEGTLQFPLLSSIRVHLRAPTTEAELQSSPSDGPERDRVSLVIVEAEEQDLSQAPNNSFLDLLTYLSECAPRTDGMVAANLDMIERSAHYPLQVNFGDHVRQCDKALVLVISKEKTIQTKIGEGSYRLTTRNVIDGVLDQAGLVEEPPAAFTLVGMCTEQNLKDGVLDPPRSGKKQQAALALITSVLGDGAFMLQMVQLVPQDDFASASRLVQKLIELSRKTQFHGTDTRPSWETTETHPAAKMRKCRKLGNNPTDCSL